MIEIKTYDKYCICKIDNIAYTIYEKSRCIVVEELQRQGKHSCMIANYFKKFGRAVVQEEKQTEEEKELVKKGIDKIVKNLTKGEDDE